VITRECLDAVMTIAYVRNVIEVVDYVQRGYSIREAAAEVGVHENTAIRYCRLAGVRSSKPQGRKR
jgi:transposase